MSPRVLIMSSVAAAGSAGNSEPVRAAAGPSALSAEAASRKDDDRVLSLFLCGDVMTGRGIDQILPHPADPALYESTVQTALDYIALAEQANGPIPRRADFSYIWGDALAELERRRPDVRIVNLETSVTDSKEHLAKGINYKMRPANVPCLTAAKIDCCVLANNHVLDWGYGGISDTFDALARASIATAGAGRNMAEAETPAVLAANGRGRVIVLGLGSPSSGIPPSWAATPDRAGVNFLGELSHESVRRIARLVRGIKRPGDAMVVSIHWGGNWGYAIPEAHIWFAHALIDRAGVSIVHGHSSHHAKAIEVHNGRLVLYGCGDFLNDYEGIAGYEEFRDDLALAYFPTVAAATGALVRLEIAPFRIKNFRLAWAARDDVAWIARTLGRESKRFGTRIGESGPRRLVVEWS
jgi:poly-gamma-glutamate synthesis protein (capsule biosynthesis protein)